MQVDDIPLMSMLKNRMSWLSKRQEVLAQNVASSDVPGYNARDLKPMNFEETLRSTQKNSSSGLMVTDPRHIALHRDNTAFKVEEHRDVAAAPNGNSVSLESEMIKVADTQAQYQAATNIYAKAIGMMKTAIGRGGG
ncbi:flagellar basal-body rod protein FlgB [Rhizomicrobium palustre]|jgi:flagellar basal-body rod protein FlgB|uniref:Flagellar basal body rod protein FlgB n=1 Tax=Rhizomicrobium palustre TaxID=189966 RepID=A0A846MY42_9PROT|nr:flagellar basal body rod protein FlgB [Rhizomicrobium palustre]NIK88316.1 flagellar basal-body rod protein FlgB [Rhizomicrobium palustre]